MNPPLTTLPQQFQSARVLVVGDTMLDRYWFGEVERISPEAPVPVAKIERMDQRAGGAGNVARNIAALGGQAALLSVVGQDEAANELEKIIQSNGVQTFLEHDETIDTTVKLRVLSRNQQLLRIDFEEKPRRAGSAQPPFPQSAAGLRCGYPFRLPQRLPVSGSRYD